MIILASGSPRRQELLARMGVEFKVQVQEFEEKSEAENPRDYAMDIARQKAMLAKQSATPQDIVIAADTVVCMGNCIMGKPKTCEDAAQMLAKLSGKTHHVITGVCIASAGYEKNWFSETSVEFFNLTDTEIAKYIKSGEPMDKAGAYGIQGLGAYFVKKIDGDFYNVMGLPIAEVCRALNEGRIEKE